MLQLRYEGRTASFRAGADELGWLQEFLTPCFERVDETARASLEIEVVETEGTARSYDREVPAFAFERGMKRLPAAACRVDGGEAWLVRDEELDVCYRVRVGADSHRVRVETACGNPRARVASMRLVRELVMNDALEGSTGVLHAAAVAGASGATLIAGPKRAGKTTCLVHALRIGADFISNDRVLVIPSRKGLMSRGIPTIVRIRLATLDGLPARLRSPLEAGWMDHRASLDEIDRGLAPARPRPGRPRNLSPAQLCRWLGAAARREGAIERVLLLRTARKPGIEVTRLAPQDAERRLADCCFDPARPASVLVPSPRPAPPSPADPGSAWRDLSRNIPCHDLALGIRTPPDEIARAMSSLIS